MRIASASVKFTLIACIAAVALTGCSPMPELADVTSERAYDIGVAALAAEDYLVAIEAFRRVTDGFPLSPEADDALVGLADAHRGIREYALAESEYRRLIQDYPDSPLVPEAEYKLAATYHDQALPATLDQSMTRRALQQLERFLAVYPGSEHAEDGRTMRAELRSRLAEKLHLSAELYFSLDDADAAIVYLDAIVDEYGDTPWAPRALREKIRALEATGQGALADEARALLETRYPDEGGVSGP